MIPFVGSEPEQLFRVREEDFAFDGFGRGVFAEGGDGAGSLAAGAAAEGVGAIAAVEDFVLMLFEEPAGVILIAQQ